MRRIVAIVLVVAACGGGSPTLPGTLGTIDEEVDAAVSGVAQVLNGSGSHRTDVYELISGLSTTVVAGELYDQVTRLEEPTIAADLERYTRFVGELLLASGDMDTAIARDDVDLLAFSWLRIEAASGVMAVGLDPEWCLEVLPPVTADLCRPVDLAEGYDAGLERAVRLFLARYRPVVRLPEAFGNGVRAFSLMTLSPEVLSSIDAALEDLAVLNPPDLDHRRVHDSFVSHLGALRAIWEIPINIADGEVVPPVIALDVIAIDASIDLAAIWLSLFQQLQSAACQGAEVFAAARTPLRVSQPASTIPALGELWFYGEGTGCP